MLTPDTILQGRYRVLRQLGRGGMGTVYEAIDDRFESTVALKETLFTDEGLRRQFEREARLLNKLRHPAMTRVVDHFTEGHGQYLVMDFVPGEDLWGILKQQERPFELASVIEWGDQLLDVLTYLHSQTPPIIHRDIKPQNLKLTDQGQIILLDFGLAKGTIGQMTTVATSHSVLGYSLAYAPLEQMLRVEQHWIDMLSVNHAEQVAAIQRQGTDVRSDLYSLGATLLHLLTNKVPPNAPTRALSVWSGRPDPVEALFEDHIPPAIANVLRRSLALTMDGRYASAGEMQRALAEARRAGTSGDGSVAEQRETEMPVPTGYAPTFVADHRPAEAPVQTQPPQQQPQGLAATVVLQQQPAQPWAQQPPPQQPWDQGQPAAQPFSNYTAPKRKYLPLMIGGGVLMLAIIVVVIILATTSSSKKSLSTPTGAARAHLDAFRKRDAAALKRTLSKNLLAQLNQLAMNRGTSVDGMLQQLVNGQPLPDNLEPRGEQIDGDYATVSMDLPDGRTLQLPLVKEDGEWKVNAL